MEETIYNVQCKKLFTMLNGRDYLLCSMEETIYNVQCKKLFTMFNGRDYLLCSMEETIYYVQWRGYLPCSVEANKYKQTSNGI